MTTEKRFDRKSFLTTGVAAWAAVTLGACSDEGDAGGTDETGGASTGGTGVGGANTGGTVTGGAGTGGSATGGSTMGGAGAGGNAMGGAGTGGSAIAGTSGSGGDSGGASGGGTGGSAGSGGGTLTCTTETSNGTHSHPLVVPPGDVERGYQDAPYILEDGGTGHTHTVELDAYEFVYLAGGTAITHVSSETEMHTHDCVVTCVVR